MEKKVVFKLVPIEMEDVKKGDRIIMFHPNGKLFVDEGQASFTAKEDAKPEIDPETQETFWQVNVNMVRKQYESPNAIVPNTDVFAPKLDYEVKEL